MDDVEYTDILGPKCPDCGWRQRPDDASRIWHRPPVFGTDPCPHWVPDSPDHH